MKKLIFLLLVGLLTGIFLISCKEDQNIKTTDTPTEESEGAAPPQTSEDDSGVRTDAAFLNGGA